MNKIQIASVSTLVVTLAAVLLASTGLTVALPATAGAYATPAAENLFSTAPGLPDGRVYEQVSPANKNGNEAGAKTIFDNVGGENRYAFAAADGNSVLFEGTGPMGEVATPINPDFIATKNKGAAGWSTRGITPAPQEPVYETGGTVDQLEYIDPSADLSHVMFEAGKSGTYALPPHAQCGYEHSGGEQLYLSGQDPFVPATWLERAEIEDPIENCNYLGESGAPVGGTPDFSTVYFTVPGTLLPEDAPRALHAGSGANGKAWGFYEDHEGSLREAGVLPDGGLDPFGAVPAASGHGRAPESNEVSANGSRAFFVSPDPASCSYNGGQNDCTVDPPQLYVRENGTRTVLLSQDTRLPDVGGLPSAAPGGVLQMTSTTLDHPDASYVFASPDGSQAFFQSEDALTKPAEEVSPGTEPKTYDFDVNTDELTYLPGVVGQIVATDTVGPSLAFVRPEAGGSPAELDLWSAGPNGGSVTPITQLPKAGVSLARMSSDGSTLVFVTSAILAGGFNSGGFRQIYRYDAAASTLGCVSCPPHGVTPTGNVSMSPLRWSEEELTFFIRGTLAERGISADGNRVFFETPDPLVPQDTNTTSKLQKESDVTEQLGRDVYEWENGVVYLISSGKSSHDSYFLDNSENGDDVFFATSEGLVPGDTDGAYDVYDARVPQAGDNPPPAAVPCKGAVCQGPPNVPSPLTPPASATFSGLGNPAPEPAATPPPAKKTTTKTVKCKKGFTKKKNKCVKTKKAKRASNKRGAK